MIINKIQLPTTSSLGLIPLLKPILPSSACSIQPAPVSSKLPSNNITPYYSSGTSWLSNDEMYEPCSWTLDSKYFFGATTFEFQMMLHSGKSSPDETATLEISARFQNHCQKLNRIMMFRCCCSKICWYTFMFMHVIDDVLLPNSFNSTLTPWN